MKKLTPLNLLCLIILFASCKSFKNLAAKDVSGSSGSKQTKSSNNTVFLDNVSVMPGSKRTTIVENNSGKKTYTPPPAIHTNAASFNIENASQDQIKYATILDLPVETLTNDALLQNIDHWWGTKYCMGGSTETCIDCSSFTQAIMHDVYATSIPRTAQEQYDNSTRIEDSQLIQGDLVFFQTTRQPISHVGVYLGNSKFVHASVSSGVMISDLNEAYWKQRYKGAGRVLR